MSEDPAASSEESGPQPLEFIRPWIYDKQRLAIFEPRDSRGDLARYSLIEASTKVGKTIGCLAWLAERAFAGTEGQNFWWVAPVYRQAKIAYRRAKRGLDRRLYTANETEMAMRLCNGATIAFLSADRPDGLYGEDVFAAVIDEASRVKEDAWHAVRSTLTATRGPARIIGNVKGRRNWFYQLARRAEAGEPGMSHHRIVAADAVKAGVLAAEELEDARRLLPEPVFRELFLAEPSDDGGNPFGLDSIAACVAPLSLEAPLFWGWDLAKSRDFSVGHGPGPRAGGFDRRRRSGARGSAGGAAGRLRGLPLLRLLQAAAHGGLGARHPGARRELPRGAHPRRARDLRLRIYPHRRALRRPRRAA
jgi:hypothetical protein